ncbi:MAG: hypothetical protein ACRDQZ_23985, partial [Mycobacteriales bacterium]
PILGPATSDATFWRRGRQTTRRGWPANSWSIRPQWQKLAVRLLVVAAIVSLALWHWVAGGALLVMVCLYGAFLLWRKPWQRDPVPVTNNYDPLPLFEGLRPILGIPDRDRWHQWLGIPADIDRPDRVQPVNLRLPDNWSQVDSRHGHVIQIAQYYLPGEWTPIWYLDGYVEFHPLPEQIPLLPPHGAIPEPAVDGDLNPSIPEGQGLPRYQPPEVDPEFSPLNPIVIDGAMIERGRRDLLG